jgi:hypothetical protein
LRPGDIKALTLTEFDLYAEAVEALAKKSEGDR